MTFLDEHPLNRILHLLNAGSRREALVLFKLIHNQAGQLTCSIFTFLAARGSKGTDEGLIDFFTVKRHHAAIAFFNAGNHETVPPKYI